MHSNNVTSLLHFSYKVVVQVDLGNKMNLSYFTVLLGVVQGEQKDSKFSII